MNKALVSVIITNYNYASYISDAIDSVLAQKYRNIEIIIIDDGSLDHSDEIISEYSRKYSRINYIKQKNKGVVASRNIGIDKAKGDYIVFLDGDDKFPANYISETLAAAVAGNLDVIYTDFERFDGDDARSSFREYDETKLRSKNYIHVSSLIKRSAIGDIRFDGHLDGLSHEDWDFILALSYKGLKFKKIDSTYLLYRSHDQSRSATNSEYALRAVKAYFYILNKYKEQYPGTMEINEDSELVEAWLAADEGRRATTSLKKTIDRQEVRIIELQDHIGTLEDNIGDILNSHRYRIGKIILGPLSFLKKFLQGEGHDNDK